MKKKVLFLLLVWVCASFFRVFADGTCGENVTWSLSSDGILRISGTGPMEDSENSREVPWKDSRKKITGVIVDEGVTRIGNYAFYDCSKLQKASLPESLTAIGDEAFYGCANLSDLNVPVGIVSIGKEAFKGCKNLTSFPVPDALEIIEDETFSGCSKLENVILPDTLQYIGKSAFANCSSLTRIIIPANVTYISDNFAFADCGNLREILVDPENTCYISVDGVLFDIDQSILLYYPAGKTDAAYAVPLTVTELNDYAFYGNGNIISLTLSDYVMTAGNSAFSRCSQLEQIFLPESLRSIGDLAFSRCSSLKEITFPASLISLGFDPFSSCAALASINVEKGSGNFSSEDGILFSADKTVLVAYPPARYDTAYVIPEGVKTIGDHAFSENKNLEHVTFPDSLTGLGIAAFSYCSRLTGITFPAALVTIGNFAFTRCTALNEIVIPESVISIGSGAFSYCENLVSAAVLNPETELYKSGVFDHCGDGFILSGFTGSTAEEHANAKKLQFAVLELPLE